MIFKLNSLSIRALFFCLLGHLSYAQSNIRMRIPVTKDNKILQMPLTGGLNAPQFSSVDLNGDGRMDLYAFDRAGDVHLTFMYENGQYVPAFDYANHFPPTQHWVLLRDFNGDSIQDLFAFSDIPGIAGIMAYTGYYERDTLKFDRINLNTSTGFNVIHTTLRTGGSVPLFVSTIDYPDLNDIDCDGDLDVLTFNVAGGIVEFHQNLSVERGFGQDSLLFRLEEPCWGGFFESGIDEIIDLSTVAGQCVTNFWPGDRIEPRHAGSTVLSLDMNNDGAKELLLGDISFNNLVLLRNAGNCQEAWMNDQTSFFPNNSVAANIPIFPAAFHLDINQDGNKDLLGAPNAILGAEDREVVWYYENEGTNANPQFEFRQRDFLVEEMLDFGSGANPEFIDINQDGLLDLIVGNTASFDPNGSTIGRLAYLENRGDVDNPAFVLVDLDYLDLSRLGQRELVPAFGDLNGDQFPDLFIGTEAGTIVFFEHLGNSSGVIQFAAPQVDFQGIDVGTNAAPELLDVDQDQLPDLVIGERDGNLNLFKNEGTLNEPKFSSEPTDNFWGGVDTRNAERFALSGESKPKFVRTNGGEQFIVCGTMESGLLVYDFVADTDLFSLNQTALNLINEGGNTSVDFGDINGDGLYEIVVGNRRGGLGLFTSTFEALDPKTSTSSVRKSTEEFIYPNPAADQIYLNSVFKDGLIQMYNQNGQLLNQYSFKGMEEKSTISISNIPNGIYILKIKSRTIEYYQKLIIQR